jgi:hypothetical protein
MICENWEQAIDYVLRTGEDFVHENVTIKYQYAIESIVLVTSESTKFYIPSNAELILNRDYEF